MATKGMYRWNGSNLILLGSGEVFSATVERSSLNGKQGTYKPSLEADNVGVPAGTVLTAGPTGNVSVTTATVFENLDCTAYFVINTNQPVVFRRCKIRGWNRTWGGAGGDTALINCDPSIVAENVIIEDCDLIPDYPDSHITGIMGHGYTARRNRIENTVDFFASRNASAPSGTCNNKIYANLCRGLSYFTPDVAGNRPNTHNDGIQVNFSSGHDIVGNVFSGKPSSTAGTAPYGVGTGSGANTYGPAYSGRGINVTGGNGTASLINIDRNWFDSFLVAISLPGVNPVIDSITITNNRFSATRPNISTGATNLYLIQVGTPLSVPGFDNTSTNSFDTNNGNIDELTGSGAAVHRGNF